MFGRERVLRGRRLVLSSLISRFSGGRSELEQWTENATASQHRYYGGVGVPLRISYRTEYNYSHGMIGANAAMHALMLDLDFWCEDSTLSRIAAGTFSQRFHSAAGAGGSFMGAKKSKDIGGR